MTKTLLNEIFNQDFSDAGDSAAFHARFFARTQTIHDLAKVSAFIASHSVTINGRNIPSAIRIPGKKSGTPLIILAQLHGNEPAGLAGILLAMALADAGQLENDVIGVVGNPLAARQYFEAYARHPHARQETRDAFRCGLDDNGNLLPDGNRIPVDFMSSSSTTAHIRRSQELFILGQNSSGIIDIHSARGNMLCITDHKHDADLKNSPIRSVLTGLAEAISAHASASVTVQTLKTILHPLPNIQTQTGIEAGRHEAPDSPYNAASFTLSALHTLKLTKIAPLFTKENGVFVAYDVQPRITYADLAYDSKTLRADDHVYMAKTCRALASVPERSDTLIVRQGDHYALQSVAEFTQKPAGSLEFALYQYDEMEPIDANQVVAVALPSGTVFSTTSAFSGIFLSKSAALYDKDPAVGPWPVHADKIGSVKFCYPCQVKEMKINF